MEEGLKKITRASKLTAKVQDLDTNESTYHLFSVVDVRWGNSMMDEISTIRKLA